jgi:hypothetical protein
MSDERRADHRTGARTIFNNDCLPKPFADALGSKSGDQVIRAAGTKPHHPADSAVRPFRACRWHGDQENK